MALRRHCYIVTIVTLSYLVTILRVKSFKEDEILTDSFSVASGSNESAIVVGGEINVPLVPVMMRQQLMMKTQYVKLRKENFKNLTLFMLKSLEMTTTGLMPSYESTFVQPPHSGSSKMDDYYAAVRKIKEDYTSTKQTQTVSREENTTGTVYTFDLFSSDAKKYSPDNFTLSSASRKSDSPTEFQDISNTFSSDGLPMSCKKIHKYCRTVNSTRAKDTCSCEEDCLNYGNCCPDYSLNAVESSHRMKWSCAKTRENAGYYAISTCLPSVEDSYVSSQCESKDDINSDGFRRVPVSSKDTLLTYRNIFCAVCNSDLNVEVWTAEFDCPYESNQMPEEQSLTNVAYKEEKTQNLWSVTDIGNKYKNHRNITECIPRFLPPVFASKKNESRSRSNTLPLKNCEPDMIRNCSEQWLLSHTDASHEAIILKCLYTHAPVSLFDTDSSDATRYNNKFCAICNGKSGTNVFCPRRHPPPPNATPQQPSLSLLLDIDFTQGGTIVGSQERCPKMHLYDPWRKVCRNVICGWQYKFHDGKCILRKHPRFNSTTHFIHYQFNSSLTSNCLQMTLASEEVSVFGNGTLVIINDGRILLPGEYEHTSNNTINVCVPDGLDGQYVSTFTNVQGHLTIIGISASLISLLTKIFLSIFIPEPNKMPPKIVLFLSISLFGAQLFFLFGIYRTEHYAICACIGILMHYCFLATFFWMNVLAYDIWKTFSSSKLMKAKFNKRQLFSYCLYGWLTPLLLVSLAAISNWVMTYPLLQPRYGEAVCWISNKVALLVFFALPLAVLLFVNVFFFVSTAFRITQTAKAAKFAYENTGRSDRVQLTLYCKLALIMGLTWLFGFVAAFAGSTVLWYLFIVFNSIQGVYVLMAFTPLRIPLCLRRRKTHRLGLHESVQSRSSATLTTSVSNV